MTVVSSASHAQSQQHTTVQPSLTIGVLGGSPATGNLGVSALGMATASALRRAFPSAHVILQNTTREPAQLRLAAQGREFDEIELMFLHESRRWKARSGTRHVALLQRMARWIPARFRSGAARLNRTLEQILRCDAILDVSSGDSFSDIYGWEQFRAQVAVKEFALGLGKPLVLLPQTFGPFREKRSKRLVADVVRRATLTATREAGGREELRSLLGDDFDDRRIVACPDVAFSLEPVAVELRQEAFLTAISQSTPLIGINVSGLLYSSKIDFALHSFDYRNFLLRLIRWAIDDADCAVLLVPHVVEGWKKVPPSNSPMTDHRDSEACAEIFASCAGEFAGRLGRVEGKYDAGQIKSLIGKCDFFVGARMHACIAAISQSIPTAVIAYSKKARGVMSLVGAEQCVVDPRSDSAHECLSAVKRLFSTREEIRRQLQARMPGVRNRVDEFFSQNLRKRLRAVGLSV